MSLEEINVLLVDDEQDFLEQEKEVLKEKDDRFVIETSDNVEEALELLENKNMDAVVSDYQMPEKDGIEFLRILREEKENRIPFILFTGRGWEEVAMNALNYGADKYIWKKEELNLYNKTQDELVEQYEILAQELVNEVKKYEDEKTMELMRHTIEKAEDGIFWVSLEGEILYGNEKVREMVGYDQKEIQDLTIYDIDTSFSEDEREDAWEKLKEEGSRRFETEHEAKDGTTFPVKVTSNYISHEDRELEFAFVRKIED
ncbi:MAG: response regulator [Candidatus Thermoplasmatota archaeon]